MRFIFSQREKARHAAKEAAASYRAYVDAQRAKHEPVQEYWDYVVNAALDALDERP